MAAASELRGRVSTDVIQDSRRIAEAFATASPFRHAVIDEFLAPDFCRSLVEQFPRFDEAAALNEDGKVGGKATQEQVRTLGPAYEQLDDLVQSAAFRDFIGTLTGIDDLRYDPHYFGGGTHENRQGQDLDPHIDFNYHPLTRQHRRLNLIIYLNEQWNDDWGGCLQLHRDPYREPEDDEIVTVTPLMNRCVLFETTERSWHGFERINLPEHRQSLSRRSFALYYYTTRRPPDETVAEHSTVYVERHLPERFRVGMTLAQDDVRELKQLLARRDQHLRRLYRRVHELGGRGTSVYARLMKSAYAVENATGVKVTVPLKALRAALRRKP